VGGVPTYFWIFLKKFDCTYVYNALRKLHKLGGGCNNPNCKCTYARQVSHDVLGHSTFVYMF
jgi:hypothetical protein